MKRVVITGATGMIGLAIIRKMVRENIEVLVIARPGSKRNARIPRDPLVTVKECDLSDFSGFDTKEKYDCFFHLAWAGTTGAARNDMDLQTKNIQGTLDAVELAAKLGCEVFIGAGSQAEYGRVSDGSKLSPSTPCFPENGYGMGKFCAGKMSKIKAEQLGMRHVWMRILSIYGPLDGMQSMVMSGIKQLHEGVRPQYTKGEQMWDYLYCDDAAEAFFLAAEKAPHGAVYCLGSGQVRPLSEYITIIRDTVRPGAEIGFGEIPYYPQQVMYLCADIDILSKETGFVPKTPFEEGIRNTYEWYSQAEAEEQNK